MSGDITRNIQFLCAKNTKNATKCIKICQNAMRQQ